jgi:hypothetical protein
VISYSVCVEKEDKRSSWFVHCGFLLFDAGWQSISLGVVLWCRTSA